MVVGVVSRRASCARCQRSPCAARDRSTPRREPPQILPLTYAFLKRKSPVSFKAARPNSY